MVDSVADPTSVNLWHKTLWHTPPEGVPPTVKNGAYVRVDLTLAKNVENYNLPYVAVAGIGMAFMNGLLTGVKLVNGNQVCVTDFTPEELEDDDVLTLFIII